MKNYSLIEFQEEEEIPLKVLVEEQESKFQLAQPLSYEITTLVNHISVQQQRKLQEEIKMWSNFSTILNKTQNIKEFNKIRESIKFEISTEFVNELKIELHFSKKNETKYYSFETFIKKIWRSINSEVQNIEEKKKNIKSNVAILIYQGEQLENLIYTINYFLDQQIVPIVIITSRKHIKQFFKQKYNEKIYNKAYVQLYKHYSLSENHAFLFEEQISEQNIAYYFAFFRELDQIQLIKWIYLGILTFIDPEFVVITQSNLEFICQISDYFPLISEKNKIFGIQWFDYQIQDQKLKNLSYYLQFPQSIINSHSIFKVKQFHNPFQCIYKWSLINNYISNYYELLKNTQENTIGVLELNSVLPKLMFESEQLELLILKKYISISKIILNSENTLVNYFINIRQKIHNQMRNHEIITNNFKIYIFSTFQNIFNKFQFIQGYFSISICIFFSFQSPYQLIFYITEESSAYIAIAMIIPLFYLFNLLIFTLFSNLYHFEDMMEFQNQFNILSYILKQNEHGEVQGMSGFDSQNVELSENVSLQNGLIKLQIEVQQENQILDFEQILSKSQNQEIILQARIKEKLTVNGQFMILISIQKILDFTVFLFTFSNLVILYGKSFWDSSVIYQSCIFFLVIFIILIEFFQKGFNLFTYTYNFSFLAYFWQIQNVNNKQFSPQVQLTKKKQLAELLLSNAIVSYCFIAVESYFNYSGYIFLGILGYLSLISVISGILQIIFYKTPQFENYTKTNVEDNSEKQQQYEISLKQQDRIKLIREAKKFVNYLIKEINQKNQEGQQSQKQQQNLNQDINNENLALVNNEQM
ncbi:unnamed protein product [Paramecium pentaurelia]|uniref:Transmembrane protein n=1 Tax=Paramecium pentaurelia TaxID=43138 RepID=A0A8S1WFG3_9CILI|nr:unnamed protein product [Paramecium pentaurelia]